MTVVRHRVLDGAGQPVVGHQLTAVLMVRQDIEPSSYEINAPQNDSFYGAEIVRQLSAVTGSDGWAQWDLVPNDYIYPAGSYYRVFGLGTDRALLWVYPSTVPISLGDARVKLVDLEASNLVILQGPRGREGITAQDLDTAISAAVSSLVEGAPGALDTLNELAAALGDDANFATTVSNQLASKVSSATYTAGLALKQNKATLGADVAADPTVKAALVPFWAPGEVVAQGAVRMTALGVTITRNAAGTTGASYDAAEAAKWTAVSSGGGSSTVDGITDAGTAGKAVLKAATAATARSAIGAGTSSFSGAYGDLTGQPSIPAPTTDASALTTGTLPPARIGDASITPAKFDADFAETVQDIVGGMVVAGTGIAAVYDDPSGKLNIAAGGGSLGNISPLVHLTFASISPAPVATYSQLGVTTGAGLYYPIIVNVEGKIANPVNGAKYYMLCSTNHSQGAGGIYLLTANSPAGPWTAYTGGPSGSALIYQDTTASTFSTETPDVVWDPVSRQFFMYYQQAGVGGNQGTVLAISPDLLTFDRIGAVLTGMSPLFPGDQHLGYAQVRRLGRYQWIARHLNGGSDYSYSSLSYSYDGVRFFTDTRPNGPHTDMTGKIGRQAPGRVNWVQVNGGLHGVSAEHGFSSGVATGQPTIVSGPLTDELDRWARPPQVAWEQGYAWESDLEPGVSVFTDNDGSVYLVYVAGTKAAGGIGIARGSITPMREVA